MMSLINHASILRDAKLICIKCHWPRYNYHPCWSVTRRFDFQRKVRSPKVIIGILYRIFLHQTPSKRIPAALRKYSIYYIKCLLHLRLEWRTNRWTPCLLSVESKEAPIIGNTWVSRENFLGISSRAVDLTMRSYD